MIDVLVFVISCIRLFLQFTEQLMKTGDTSVWFLIGVVFDGGVLQSIGVGVDANTHIHALPLIDVIHLGTHAMIVQFVAHSYGVLNIVTVGIMQHIKHTTIILFVAVVDIVVAGPVVYFGWGVLLQEWDYVGNLLFIVVVHALVLGQYPIVSHRFLHELFADLRFFMQLVQQIFNHPLHLLVFNHHLKYILLLYINLLYTYCSSNVVIHGLDIVDVHLPIQLIPCALLIGLSSMLSLSHLFAKCSIVLLIGCC